MKTLKFFLMTLLLGCLAANTVDAQALVCKDEIWHCGPYTSCDAHEVITPDGTVNLKINFQFDLTDPWVLMAISLGEPFVFEGSAWDASRGLLIPCILKVFQNGRVMVLGKIEPRV